MRISRFAVYLAAVALALGAARGASAHGMIGQRFFPATLAIDDPFVADELSLPTVSLQSFPSSDDSPAFRQTNISAEFSKRITPDLGFSLNGNLAILDPDHGKTQSGFENLEVSLKYVFWKDAEHELLVSAGVSWEVGGTGGKNVGADSFDTVSPQLFFGKGMGDLPEALEWLRPVAITGAFGYDFPTRRFNKTYTVSDEGTVEVDKELNPQVFQWGLSLQYNLQYLQSFVRDIGLPAPFNRMIPLVEVPMQTIVQGPLSGQTTGTVNPGIIWFGRYMQLGFELQIPVNHTSGRSVGVLAQMHFYLDDIAPDIFTWTPFHGFLGPTQPR